MTVDAWLESASSDAERRGLPELKPLLTTLAGATRALREADAAVADAEQRAGSVRERAK